MDNPLAEENSKKVFALMVDETNTAIRKEIESICFAGPDHCNDANAAFLQARESYMSDAEKKQMKEPLSRKIGPAQEVKLIELPRSELENMAHALGFEDASRTVFKKNSDLVAAIEEAQKDEATQKEE